MPQWMNTRLVSRRPSRRCLGCLKLLLKEMLKQRRLRAHFLSELLYLSKRFTTGKEEKEGEIGRSKLHAIQSRSLASSVVLSTCIINKNLRFFCLRILSAFASGWLYHTLAMPR